MPLLSIFGDLERLISEDLYPYRYVITPLVAAGAAGLVALAIWKGAHRFLWRHRLASAVVGGPLLIVAVVAGDYLISPLWERSFLEEPSPVLAQDAVNPQADARGSSAASSSAAPTQRRGTFEGADDFHFGRGEALLLRSSDGSYVLRFENFSVRNGPDLYVYLSRDTQGEKVEETLNLGRLKATDGSFNYEVPASIDPSSIKSVLIWCKQFSVLFASAEFEG